MSRRYQGYPEYKNSGVKRLGVVPTHWKVKRLKHGMHLLTEKAQKRTNPIALENIESWTGRLIPSDSDFQGDGIAIERGDILFGKLRPYLAKAYRAESSGEAVGDFHVMRPSSQIDSRYGQFLILNREFIADVDGSTYGSKMPRASWEFVGGMKITAPPLPEQKQIAAFLDHETAKIDRLIGKQRELIRLLKEKRQAVISHAVTKGLNPDAPLKYSGIEWLGQIPAHWTLNRVKYNASLAGRIGFRGYTTDDLVDEGDGAITLSPGNFDGGNLTFDKKTYISWRKYHESPEIKLATGDIVMVKTGSTLGKLGFVDREDEPMTINPQIVIFKKIKLRSRFLFHYLGSPLIQSLVSVSNTGGTMPTMTQECIGNYPLLVPPLDEQDDIVAVLSEHCRKFDGLIENTVRALALLQERRTALISAAVTGRIDVRDWQPSGDQQN